MGDAVPSKCEPRSGKRFVFGGLTVLLATTALSNVALAAPAQCQSTETGAFVCTGNQSKGAANGNSGINPGATSITVRDLTALSGNAPYTGPFAITSDQPATDVPSVSLDVELGDIKQVISDEKTRNVSATTKAATSSASAADIVVTIQGNLTNEAAREVVELTSTGSNGDNGSDSGDGRPGGNGGDGGDIVLTFGPSGGTSLLSGPDGDTAVVLTSSGGSGGAGSGTTEYSYGGGGGRGGSGGALTILSNGNTTISSAPGSIWMRSVGSDGGSGGKGASAGGAGGAGGYGGALFFDRDASGTNSAGSWTVTRKGDGGEALFLESIGGTGNFSGESPETYGPAGGTGGHAGTIAFGNAARSITVLGTGSTAVAINGVGGNGGDGSPAKGYGTPGDGGNAGNGSRVALDGSWDISATAEGSIGISVTTTGGRAGTAGSALYTARNGGVGGDGGTISSIISGDSNIHSDGTAIAFSSTGGKGGRGNNVNRNTSGRGNLGGAGGNIFLDIEPGGATSTGSWTIRTTSAPAIALVSTGGDGGYGGSRSGGDTRTDGGRAGAGGVGGSVEIKSGSRTIATTGSGAHGLYVLTVGGVGGLGGTSNKTGGTGGDGGGGGDIAFDVEPQQSVDKGWDIKTTGPEAFGIAINSRGGEGSRGGGGGSRNNGNSGSGGYGGDIVLAQGSRTISTADQGSHGILLSSLGGDGGSANTAGNRLGGGGAGGRAGNITVSGTTTVVTRGSNAAGFKIEALGGDGKGLSGEDGTAPRNSRGGNGGAVALESDSSVQATTYGPSSDGISILSQGGLGGFGASGGEGPSGVGGDISVLGNLIIETSEENSSGISMISRGGAGKVYQSVGGSAGSVTMVADVSIKTAGDGAPGLVALSQGGSVTGSGAAVAAGDGSSVNVRLIGGQGIITSGEASHGLVAQSVGGTNFDTNEVGTASTVNVDTEVDAIASGPGAQGIYAQSVGKSGGDITVTVGVDALVFGGVKSTDTNVPDGAGIRIVGGTQDNSITNYGRIGYSYGPTQTGNAIVTVGDGYTTVTVGSGGVIYGNVIRDKSSADGNIADGQSGGIALINERSGILNAGTRLDANVTNRGLLSPGGKGAQRTTAVSGDLRQTSTGTLAIEVSGEGTHDRVDVAGTAQLNGEVEIELTDLDSPLIGRQTRTILTAEEGVTAGEGLTLTQSLVAGFELLDNANDRVRIGFEVDFSNDDATADLNNNQANIAGHLQHLYEAGLIDTDLAGVLISLDDANDYAGIVNNMSAEVILDNQITAVQAFRAFQGQLLSCADTAGTYAARFLDDGSCVFATARGAGFDRDATSDSLGYNGSAWSVSGGGQVAFGEAWTIGGALGYEWQQLDVSGASASSDGHSVFAGVSVKRHFGALELGASSSVGYGTYDIDRQPFPGERVDADQNFWSLGGRVRAAYVFGSEKVFIKPRVELGIDHVFGSSFKESGNTGLRLSVDTDDEAYVSLAPAIEFGAEFVALDGVRIRPHAAVGLTQYLNNPSPSLTAKFADAGTTVDGFDASTDIATTFFDLSGGVDIFAKDHAVMRAGAFTSLSRDDTIYGGSLRLEIPF